ELAPQPLLVALVPHPFLRRRATAAAFAGIELNERHARRSAGEKHFTVRHSTNSAEEQERTNAGIQPWHAYESGVIRVSSRSFSRTFLRFFLTYGVILSWSGNLSHSATKRRPSASKNVQNTAPDRLQTSDRLFS